MQNKILHRKIISKIKSDFKHRKIQVLVGSRQVGKTSILKYLQQEISNYIYLDIDRLVDLSMFDSVDTFLRFIEVTKSQKEENLFIFIDEFQQVPQIGKILKAIYDHSRNLQFIVSGSSSLNIMQNLDESLAGRKRVYSIYPLDFEEFLYFKTHLHYEYYHNTTEFKYIPQVFGQLQIQFEEFVRFGGYPAVSLFENPEQKVEELNDIVKSYIEKDIKSFFKINNILTYNKLLQRLGLNIGNLVNLQSVSTDIAIKRQELEKYLYLLINTYIIDLVPPFYQNKINELKKMTKLYFVDMGIRNFLLTDFRALPQRADMGALVENTVYSEFLKNKHLLQEIHFWRTTAKTEVDFIIRAGNEVFPVEVKYQNNVSAIPRAIKSFVDYYHPKRAWVITVNQYFERNYQDCEVIFLPAFFSGKIMSMLYTL